MERFIRAFIISVIMTILIMAGLFVMMLIAALLVAFILMLGTDAGHSTILAMAIVAAFVPVSMLVMVVCSRRILRVGSKRREHTS